MSDKLRSPKVSWMKEPLYDEDGNMVQAGLDEYGREIGDPVPMRPPLGLSVAQGDELHGLLRKLMAKERAAFMAAIEAEEFESEDDANDFACPEDLFPPGNEPWEDVHEFPAEPLPWERSEPVASQRASNEGRAAQTAPPPPSSQIASEDLSSESPSSATMAQTPRPVLSDDSSREPSAPPPAGRRGRSLSANTSRT